MIAKTGHGLKRLWHWIGASSGQLSVIIGLIGISGIIGPWVVLKIEQIKATRHVNAHLEAQRLNEQRFYASHLAMVLKDIKKDQQILDGIDQSLNQNLTDFPKLRLSAIKQLADAPLGLRYFGHQYVGQLKDCESELDALNRELDMVAIRPDGIHRRRILDLKIPRLKHALLALEIQTHYYIIAYEAKHPSTLHSKYADVLEDHLSNYDSQTSSNRAERFQALSQLRDKLAQPGAHHQQLRDEFRKMRQNER
ncbi:hypothetical protein EBZ35_06240 [bacterium]|nr:hypothetical protein [bacterium]